MVAAVAAAAFPNGRLSRSRIRITNERPLSSERATTGPADAFSLLWPNQSGMETSVACKTGPDAPSKVDGGGVFNQLPPEHARDEQIQEAHPASSAATQDYREAPVKEASGQEQTGWTSFQQADCSKQQAVASPVPFKQPQPSSSFDRPRSRVSAPAFEAPPSPPESEADAYPFPPSIAAHQQRTDRAESANSNDVQVNVQASSPRRSPSPSRTLRNDGLLSPPLMPEHSSKQPPRDAPTTQTNPSTQPPNQPLKRSATSHSRSALATQPQNAAAPPLLRAPSKLPEDRPLVGNLIGEDHVNYVLMYNMLTGIRIGVRLTSCLPLFQYQS